MVPTAETILDWNVLGMVQFSEYMIFYINHAGIKNKNKYHVLHTPNGLFQDFDLLETKLAIYAKISTFNFKN